MLTSASAAVAGRYMNSNINPNNETNKSGNNFIMDWDTLNNLMVTSSEKYSEYPLTLLNELNNIINAELLFSIALLYIFIVRSLINYLNNKSFKFSNKKVEKVFLFIKDRYILAWSKYEKIFSILIIVLLSYGIILSKICIYLILTS